MTKTRPIDDAKIRAVASEVEILAGVLQGKTKELCACFDKLHDEAYQADPDDRPFDKFLLELARTRILLDNLWALRYHAKVMQTYGLQSVAPTLREVGTKEGLPLGAQQRESLLPSVGAPRTEQKPLLVESFA